MMENTIIALYETMAITSEEKEMILKRRERLHKEDSAKEKFKQLKKLVDEINALGGRVNTTAKFNIDSNDLVLNVECIR